MIDLVEFVFILMSYNQILVADMFRLVLGSDGDGGVWDLRRELFCGGMYFFVGKFLRLLQMTDEIGTPFTIINKSTAIYLDKNYPDGTANNT